MNFTDSYGDGVIDERILTEIQIGLDGEKLYSERSSFGILDLFGEIGGFMEFVEIMLAPIGVFFSTKFFLSEIAKNMFLFKVPEEKKETRAELREQFEGGDQDRKYSKKSGKGMMTRIQSKLKKDVQEMQVQMAQIRVKPQG